MNKSNFCDECGYLVDIDKSQQGGYCELYGGFRKFTAVCSHPDESSQNTLPKQPEDIISKLRRIALNQSWGTVDRVDGVPENVTVIHEAIKEINTLRCRVRRLQQYDEQRDIALHHRLAEEGVQAGRKEILDILYEEALQQGRPVDGILYMAQKYNLKLGE